MSCLLLHYKNVAVITNPAYGHIIQQTQPDTVMSYSFLDNNI